MTTEKRLIYANALTDVIEETDWYHISLQGNLAHGARPDIHTPLYKADDIYQAIKDAPTVDAVEVVHGRWDTTASEKAGTLTSFIHHCPECNYLYKDLHYKGHNYCPNCGAKMDLKEA